MKKAIFTLTIVLTIVATGRAQTFYFPRSYGYSSNNNVGIGTREPSSKLTLRGLERNAFGDAIKCAIRINNDDQTREKGYAELQFGGGNNGFMTAVIGSSYDVIFFDLDKDEAREKGGGEKTVFPKSGGGNLLFGTQNINQGAEEGVLEEGVIERMRIDHRGNVGIGTKTPVTRLDVVGTTRIKSGWGDWLQFETTGRGSWRIHNPSTENYLAFGWTDRSTYTYSLKLHQDGSVGIGTTKHKGYLLSVAGNMRAEQINVSLSSGWSDYVFANDYKLKPLKDVEQFIQENKHLPDIPSEAELKETGLNIGDMQTLQMQKIEELMLYVINLQKEIEKLKKKKN